LQIPWLGSKICIPQKTVVPIHHKSDALITTPPSHLHHTYESTQSDMKQNEQKQIQSGYCDILTQKMISYM